MSAIPRDEFLQAARAVHMTCAVAMEGGAGPRLVLGEPGREPVLPRGGTLVALLPPVQPQSLGDPAFRSAHGASLAYVAGEMAHGVAGAELVSAMSRSGGVGVLGCGGLGLDAIAREIDAARANVGEARWGANLIHSPAFPEHEKATVDLFLRARVPVVSLSSFLSLTPSAVRCSAQGMTRDADGRIRRARRIMAKVSRVEVAKHFLSPPPAAMLSELVRKGELTAQEAELAARLPVADDVTAEADSAGHTDNRPLLVLLPRLLGLRDDLARAHGFVEDRPRIGAAGGLGAPDAVHGALSLGAAYVLTGSINQCCVESGLSDDAKAMIAECDSVDVAMAPSADMFELGARVQVLKRGTFFAQRAQSLLDLYKRHGGWEELDEPTRASLEKNVFRQPFDRVWGDVEAFWSRTRASELARAEKEPKHRLALAFRWYLFMAGRWAREGNPDRRTDYQIWCGPAMGAFNAWAKGTPLDALANRKVGDVAHAFMTGAAMLSRAQSLRIACGDSSWAAVSSKELLFGGA